MLVSSDTADERALKETTTQESDRDRISSWSGPTTSSKYCHPPNGNSEQYAQAARPPDRRDRRKCLKRVLAYAEVCRELTINVMKHLLCLLMRPTDARESMFFSEIFF